MKFTYLKPVFAFAFCSSILWTGCETVDKTTTPVNSPTIGSTTPLSEITEASAKSGGEITADGGSAVLRRGVCFDTVSNPTYETGGRTMDGTGTGTFTSVITGLKKGKRYYVRAYATNVNGTGYGNELSFIAQLQNPPGSPTMGSTTAVSDITETGAKTGGQILGDGGSAVTKRGVCYDTLSGPTYENSGRTNDGSGTGSFTSTITGLLKGKRYYVRAYATNANGTAYGTEINFTTLGVRSTGWQGGDDPSTIPENLNNPFDNTTPPASMDLSNYLPPIGDQGQFGTCVAWAAGYNAKTAMEAVKFELTQSQLASPSYQMSAKYLFTALDNSKKGDNCNGTDFVPAMDLMLAKGVATKSVVPYTNLGNCSQSTLDPAWNADAAKHKIKYYRRIDPTTLAIKQALAAKMPVVLGAKLDDSFMDWNSQTVYQNHTSFNNVGIHSYHAMCIIGYDNAKGPGGAFKVVNSWGQNWGASGFIWVDYNFMVNGFGFGSNPSKPNEKNFYVAVNDDQKPNPTDPDPVVNPDGVDVVPWVYDDYQETSTTNTGREMEFDLFNIGKQAANASSRWGYAYLYYNAYDANDYGVVFYDEFDPSAPAGSYNVRSGGSYTGLQINVNIPSESNFAANFGTGSPSLFRSYSMPSNLNGEYYLVMVADVTEKFTENDESNNLFYTTDQDPKLFTNGVGSRRNVLADRFKNPIPQTQMLQAEGKRFRTAVKPHRRNAYTPEEIITFLRKEAQAGRLSAKINQARNIKNGTLKMLPSRNASQH